jgi:hypothetical protein
MDTKLTALLKEILVKFNREARLVPPKLESEMCITLDRLGGEWLLLGLESQGVEGASEIRCNPDSFCCMFKHESGQKMLKAAVNEHCHDIVEMRRKLVSVIRLFSPSKQGIELTIDALPDSGDIYNMLSEWQKEGGLA